MAYDNFIMLISPHPNLMKPPFHSYIHFEPEALTSNYNLKYVYALIEN